MFEKNFVKKIPYENFANVMKNMVFGKKKKLIWKTNLLFHHESYSSKHREFNKAWKTKINRHKNQTETQIRNMKVTKKWHFFSKEGSLVWVYCKMHMCRMSLGEYTITVVKLSVERKFSFLIWNVTFSWFSEWCPYLPCCFKMP